MSDRLNTLMKKYSIKKQKTEEEWVYKPSVKLLTLEKNVLK